MGPIKDRVLYKTPQRGDDNVYRIIFEAEPIPSSIRRAGVGGIEKYKDLIEGNLKRDDFGVDYAKAFGFNMDVKLRISVEGFKSN